MLHICTMSESHHARPGQKRDTRWDVYTQLLNGSSHTLKGLQHRPMTYACNHPSFLSLLHFHVTEISYQFFMNSMSMRRRRHLFHSLFESVPLDERLLQGISLFPLVLHSITHSKVVYRCALQKDILVQGHMYVSEHHVCFKANIFGWITRVRIIAYR